MPSFYPENNTPDPDDNELKVSQKILGALLSGVANVIPTGTGFTHVTGGAQDGAAKLVENADVSATADIAWNKVSKVGAVPSDVGAQPLDSELTALASTTSAADKVPYFTGAGTASTTTVTSAARTVLDDSTVEAMQGTLKIPFVNKITKNISFTVQTTEHGTFYDVTTGDTDRVVTLPDVSSVIEGFQICVHKYDLDLGNISFTGTAGQFPAKVLYFQSESIMLRSNGTTWVVVASYFPAFSEQDTFGTGSDGDVTVSGALTLTRDYHYNKLTCAAGAAINLSGYQLFCRSYLDLRGAPAGSIFRNGANGLSSTGPTGASAGTDTPGRTTGGQTAASQAGATATTGVGAQPTSIAASSILQNVSTSATCVAGGAGGAGGSGAGGASRATTTGTPRSFPSFLGRYQIQWQSNTSVVLIPAGTTGQSGSSGAGDGANNGGGGGSGGKSGGMVFIWSRKIIRDGTTASNCITANGGNGGSGAAGNAAGNCGGGGGAGGGTGGGIFIVYGELLGSTAANALQAKGGDGGSGGNGSGTGSPGNGGYANCSGRVCIVDAKTNTFTETTGSAGVANSGQTGGTAAEFQVNL